jgi:hypothetical protein
MRIDDLLNSMVGETLCEAGCQNGSRLGDLHPPSFQTILMTRERSCESSYLHNEESLVNWPEGPIQVSSNVATVLDVKLRPSWCKIGLRCRVVNMKIHLPTNSPMVRSRGCKILWFAIHGVYKNVLAGRKATTNTPRHPRPS